MKTVGIPDVRRAVHKCVGSRVVVKSNKGRQKFDVNQGVIKEVYPHIFMILLDGKREENGRLVSFSYKDLLTKDVELCLC